MGFEKELDLMIKNGANINDLQNSETAVPYDNKHTCRKCGGLNTISVVDTCQEHVAECGTTCTKCGYQSYWAYGHFEPDFNHEGIIIENKVFKKHTKLVKIRAERENIKSQITFEKELAELINRYSMEKDSNTPDFLLAEYLKECLKTFNIIVSKRDVWEMNGNGSI